MVGWQGQHLFEHIGDPRVVLHDATDPSAPPPDLLVIPCAKRKLDFARSADALPHELWARAAAGKMAVVFDASIEGNVHTEQQTQALHGYLRKTGVPARQCVHTTQDRLYAKAYQDYCERSGIAEPMLVLNYDCFIKEFFFQYETKGPKAFGRKQAAFEQRSAERSRRFVSLNLTPRPAKVFFLLRLLRDGLWDKGHVSFGGLRRLSAVTNNDRRGSLALQLQAMDGFEDLFEALEPYIDPLDAMGEVLLGDPSQIKHCNNDMPMSENDDSWFTVVTETEMQGPRRITEKQFKSLVNFHPSISLGNPGSLELVREFGFRTFEGYFDESYDQEPDRRRRFDMVYEEVRRLCALPEAELRRMEQDLTETLTFNAHWGLTRLPAIYRDEIDVRLVEQFLTLIRADEPVAA